MSGSSISLSSHAMYCPNKEYLSESLVSLALLLSIDLSMQVTALLISPPLSSSSLGSKGLFVVACETMGILTGVGSGLVMAVLLRVSASFRLLFSRVKPLSLSVSAP